MFPFVKKAKNKYAGVTEITDNKRTYLAAGDPEGTNLGTAPIAFMAPVMATGGFAMCMGTCGLKKEHDLTN